MKKHVARILLIALLICTMASMTSCVRFNVESVSIGGIPIKCHYLYSIDCETSAYKYVYSTKLLDVGDEIKIDDESTGKVVDLIEEYNIHIFKGISTCIISYYVFPIGEDTESEGFVNGEEGTESEGFVNVEDSDIITDLESVDDLADLIYPDQFYKTLDKAKENAPEKNVTEIHKKSVTVTYK